MEVPGQLHPPDYLATGKEHSVFTEQDGLGGFGEKKIY
jgi:hypothetical protein